MSEQKIEGADYYIDSGLVDMAMNPVDFILEEIAPLLTPDLLEKAKGSACLHISFNFEPELPDFMLSDEERKEK